MEGVKEVEQSIADSDETNENMPENVDLNFLGNSTKDCLELEVDNFAQAGDRRRKWYVNI